MSGFLPSRIASFFPDEREALLTNAGVAMTTNHWEDLCDKLSIAEQDRVRKQAELIQANNFVTPVNLSDFYTANGIVDQMDVDYINSIIALGEAKSETLARMVFSQSAFLDDVPEVQWMNLGKETVGRLLVNDYEGHDEASTARNAIIAEPAMRLHESAEHLVKAVQGYAKPLGVPDAQERIEADAMTRYELYGMNTSSKWGFHAVNKVFRSATSPIEGVNEAANISMDEKAIFEDADYLAQHSVIGSDKGKLDFLGHTQLERIKRRAKAELLRVWLRNLRVFMMIFSGVFGTEFLKMIAPDLIRDK